MFLPPRAPGNLPPPEPRHDYVCNLCVTTPESCDVDPENLIGCTRCKYYNLQCQFMDRYVPTRPANVAIRLDPVLAGATPALCDHCTASYTQACDMDLDAGIGCRKCQFQRVGAVPCVYQGRQLAPRPAPGDPTLDRIRHSCDQCDRHRSKTCSWLDNPRSRTQPCASCVRADRVCTRNNHPPGVANTQVPEATPFAPVPLFAAAPPNNIPPHDIIPGVLAPGQAPPPIPEIQLPAEGPPAPVERPAHAGFGPGIDSPPQAMPPYVPVGGYGYEPDPGMEPQPAVDQFGALMEALRGGAEVDMNWAGADAQLEPDKDQAQMAEPIFVGKFASNPRGNSTEQARQVHAFMQERASKLLQRPERHIDRLAADVGDDPRLGYDPFAPVPPPQNEELEHQFPPGLDWTSTRWGAYKLESGTLPPRGVPDRPFSPGPYTRLWSGIEQPVDVEVDPAMLSNLSYPGDFAALASVPTKGIKENTYREDLVGHRCEEHLPPQYGKDAVCGAIVGPPVTHCLDRNHAHDRPTIICEACNDRSKSLMLAADAEQLRESEVLASRAYACASCLEKGAAERHSFWFSGNRVWGYHEDPNELTAAVPDPQGRLRGRFMGDPTPAWGCSCAKLLSSLCRSHRELLAEAWLTQVDLMNEWILTIFGKRVCPVCFDDRRLGIESYVFAGEQGGENCDKVMWACVSCQEFVVVPRYMGASLIPGVEEMVTDVNSYFKKKSEIYDADVAMEGVAVV